MPHNNTDYTAVAVTQTEKKNEEKKTQLAHRASISVIWSHHKSKSIS